jgi:hypothetical protein
MLLYVLLANKLCFFFHCGLVRATNNLSAIGNTRVRDNKLVTHSTSLANVAELP